MIAAAPAESPLSEIQFRVWAPPESPLRIEYLEKLLPDLAAPGSGTLWGKKEASCIRLFKTGFEQPVGKFFVRVRGEVFLTDSDLAELDRMDIPGAIALVIAGSRAGFFVSGLDGTMQTVKSYREFDIRVHRRSSAAHYLRLKP